MWGLDRGPVSIGFALLFVLCSMGCERTSAPHEPEAETPSGAKPSVAPLATREISATDSEERAVARIDPSRLRAHVEFLASDALLGRATPSPQLDRAAEYIRDHLRDAGLAAPSELPDHFQRFACGDSKHPGLASNVIALLPGRDPTLAAQTVMVSAHYDHLGERKIGRDRIYNGANDNASGTASMLLVAEVMATAPPRRSVLFVAFCGEEQGLRGSRHYAEHPIRPLDSTIAHLNLEMLGRPGDADPPRAWLPGMDRSNLSTWLTAANPDASVLFVDGYEIGPSEGGAFHRSDNFPLAQRGVIAHTIASGPLDELYHSPDDEADTLDYERMALLVQAITRGAYGLANSPDTPEWIDPPH